MLCFSNGSDFIICTSHKVMRTTLYAQNHLNIQATQKLRLHAPRAKLIHFMERKGCGKFLPGLRPYYLLVRNPLTRMESLYRNAIALAQHPCCPPNLTDDPRFQLIRLAADNIYSNHASPKDKVLSLRFETFVHGLSALFKDSRTLNYFLYEEAHSQHQSLWCEQGLRFARVLKIDEQSDRRFLQEALGINTAIIANRSKRTKDQRIEWTLEMRTIMCRYYTKDFEQFAYDPYATD